MTILYRTDVINPELELRLEMNGFLAHWTVPEELSYLAGHFPGFPVLPGVAIIDVSLEVLRRALGLKAVRLRTLQNAKFSQPLHPGQEVQIELSGDWKVVWKIRSSSEKSASVAELTLRLRLEDQAFG